MVAALEFGGSVVGTLRLVPIGIGLSPLEPLLADHAPPQLGRQAWEFGRLVLDPDHRGGPELVGRSIYLAVHHLSRCTDAVNLFASCTAPLARLYRRYGFAVVTTRVSVHDTPEPFCLIHGTVAGVLAASGAGQDS